MPVKLSDNIKSAPTVRKGHRPRKRHDTVMDRKIPVALCDSLLLGEGGASDDFEEDVSSPWVNLVVCFSIDAAIQELHVTEGREMCIHNSINCWGLRFVSNNWTYTTEYGVEVKPT